MSPALTKAGSAVPSGWVTRQVTTLAMPKAVNGIRKLIHLWHGGFY